MRRLIFCGMLSVGCKLKQNTVAAPEEITINDYHGFDTEVGWTYRDDGILDAPPSDAALLRTRYVGDGVLDMRRGSRWADAIPTAEIVFRLDGDFSIVGWNLGPYAGTGDLTLGNEPPLHGQSVQSGGWFCSTVRRTEVETYYAFFDDVIQFQCSGGGGPEGDWTFAKEVGLVAFDGVDYSLSLVAPW